MAKSNKLAEIINKHVNRKLLVGHGSDVVPSLD